MSDIYFKYAIIVLPSVLMPKRLSQSSISFSLAIRREEKYRKLQCQAQEEYFLGLVTRTENQNKVSDSPVRDGSEHRGSVIIAGHHTDQAPRAGTTWGDYQDT